MDIYLIRHTAPDIPSGHCYGQHEVGLAPSWPDEFTRLRDKLPDDWDRVYSSPWPRCRRLAQRLASDPTEDPRLQELHFGRWEGQAWSAIPPEELTPWMDDFVNVPCPEGESYRMLAERVDAFWKELVLLDLPQVAVVTHAGPLRALLSSALGLPLDNSFRLAIDYGGVSLIRWQNQRPTIQFINT